MTAASQQDGTYPRPQLVRDKWTSLDGEWDLAYDDADAGVHERWFAPGSDVFDRRILVPFVPESAASGIGDNGYHPVVWYRRSLPIARREGARNILHLGAVDHEARVWVDGQFVGSHSGGQTGFSFDITDALQGEGPHHVVVRAYDPPFSSELPRGKQDWQLDPHVIWYRRSTGIWRTVWIETVPDQHVVSLDWKADHSSTAVAFTIRLALDPRHGTAVRVTLLHSDRELAEVTVRATDARVSGSVEIPALRNAQARGALLWSPDQPVLVDARIEVLEEGNRTDQVFSYLGIRTAGVGRGRFLLNGVPLFVRSVLNQGYWPDSQLTAPDVDAYRSEVELILSLGFNAARVHQKVEDPRFLYWADRLGLLIWAETAAAYEFTPSAARAMMAEWGEIVEHHRNHPSVVTWVPVNESWGVQDIAGDPAQRAFVQTLAAYTRALDPTRPVISNDGWEHVDSDILSIHDYETDPCALRARYADQEALGPALSGMGPQGRRPELMRADAARAADAPLMVTEFGGIAYDSDDTWGYATVGTDMEYSALLSGLFGALDGSPLIAGFCYTQLADTLQESNGLVRADRSPKLAVEELRSIVRGSAKATLPTGP